VAPETPDLLTIRQLAEYLMVSEKTVYRMLDRNELPALRVGVQWRFRRSDIDEWLKDASRRSDVDALDAELDITPLLSAENVWLALPPMPRDELLSFLVKSADVDPHVDRDALFRALRERETVCSTALLAGAAFPQLNDPRPFRFSKKRVLLATTREPIDFHDPHGHRPSVIVAILARSVQGQLLVLSRALKLFGDPALLERLLGAVSKAHAVRIVADAERALQA